MSEIGWLIEGDGVYWNGRGVTQGDFTKDPSGAIRFLRKHDAECIKYWLLSEFKIGLRITEHSWVFPE